MSQFSKLNKGSEYRYTEDERLALLHATTNTAKSETVLVFALRDGQGAKRFGVVLMTAKQLTQGLGAFHGCLVKIIGAGEKVSDLADSLATYGITEDDLIERKSDAKE